MGRKMILRRIRVGRDKFVYLLRLMPHRAAPHPRVLELHHKLLVQAIAKVLCGWRVIMQHYRSREISHHSLRLGKRGDIEVGKWKGKGNEMG